MPGPTDLRSSRRKGTAKVKSGCRTCKIRKVKCDEGHPVCHRCISTGRDCDGYGIWGGGGSFYSHRQRPTASKDSRIVPQPPMSVSVLAPGIEEMSYFEWFKCRTAIKLPGSFISGFWTTLLFQASQNEPAVLHAVLALSSVHKGGITNANVQRRPEEKFTLRHYVSAIRHLQPYFSIKDRTSCRVALITCAVFVCLEFLRGHFQTAQTHLNNGLKILRDMQMLSDCHDGILCVKSCREATDDWITEAFSRLCLQVELFKNPSPHLGLVLQAAEPETPALVFHSINEAWQQMDRLLNKIFHLTRQSRQQAECFPQQPLELIGRQRHIRRELTQWLDMYKAFKTTLKVHRSAEEDKGYQLPCVYHTMANIMAETCLQLNDETVFDSHTNLFVLLIRQLANLGTIASTPSPIPVLPGHHMDMSRSIVDMGWIAPLYYVAVKCRVHRLRLQATRLLESTSHREGIWDAKTAACVARKVMEAEERDFYKDIDTTDEFPLFSSPLPQDLSLPTIPESHRIHEVEVVLAGDPMDTIMLFCRQKPESMNRKALVSEYSVRLQRWTDR